MEIIIQSTSDLKVKDGEIKVQKERVNVDTTKNSILFYQAYQPSHKIELKGKIYVYVDFKFKVKIDNDGDVWIIPRELKELGSDNDGRT